MRLGLGLALGRSRSGTAALALSSASVSAASATTTTGPSIYTTGTDGTIYFRLYLASATPTDPEIIAGTGAAVAEGLAVSAAGTKTFTAAAGLTSATYYTAYFVHVGVSETSAITTVTNILTYPGVVSASGTPSITVESGVGDPVITITDTDTSEVLFTGSVSAANLALAAYNVVAPSISVVGGADPAVGEQIQDDVEDLWTVNPPGAYPRGLQYDSDAVAISGATSSPFTVTASESDTDITLDVTVNTVTATSSAIVIPAPAVPTITQLSIGSDERGTSGTITMPMSSFTLSAATDVVIVGGGQANEGFLDIATVSFNGEPLTFEVDLTTGVGWSRAFLIRGTLPAGTYDSLSMVLSAGTTFFNGTIVAYEVNGGSYLASSFGTTIDDSTTTNEDRTRSLTVQADDLVLFWLGASRGVGDGNSACTPIDCTELIDQGTDGSAASTGSGTLFVGSQPALASGSLTLGAQWNSGTTSTKSSSIILRPA